MRLLVVALVATACLLSGCTGSSPSSAPTPTHSSSEAPSKSVRPADYPPPCAGSGGSSSFDLVGSSGVRTGTSEAVARTLMARYLKQKGSPRSMADAQIVGRTTGPNGAKSLAFLFDEGDGSWYLVDFVGIDGRWSIVGDESCQVIKGDLYLRGTWNVKGLADINMRMVPIPGPQFGTVQVTFTSGYLTAFDGCDDMSGHYTYKADQRGLQIPILGTSGRAVCKAHLSPLASRLRATRHVQGRGATRTLLDKDQVAIIELVR